MIAELGPDLGLELDLVKNEVVFFWDDTNPFPKEVYRFPGGFELLGSPIGDEAFCTNVISKYCRVIHLLRTVPSLYAKQAIAVFDAAGAGAWCV